MSKKSILCKKCNKQIDSGKYCKRCETVRKENRDMALKTVGGVVAGVGGLAFLMITKGKFGGGKKL